MTERSAIHPFDVKDWLDDEVICYSSVDGGLENTCTRLDLANGSRFVLKSFSSSDRYIPELESSLAKLFASHGLNSTVVHAAKDGRRIVEAQGRFSVLYHWIPGEAPRLSRRSLTDMIETMAQIHAIPPPPGLRPYHYTPDQLASDIRANWDRTAPINRVLERSWSAIDAVAAYSGEKCLCHTDIQVRNFIVTPEGVPVVIDYEHAALEAPAFDIARTIVFSSRGLALANSGFLGAVLAMYRTTRPDLEINPSALRTFLVYNFAMVLFWRYRAFNLEQPGGRFADLYKDVLAPAEAVLDFDDAAFRAVLKRSEWAG